MTVRCNSCAGFWTRVHQVAFLDCHGRGAMSFASCKQLARPGIRAVMLLLVLAPFAPGSAWAGCNHAAFSKGHKFGTLANLDPLITGAFPVPYASTRIGSPGTPDEGKLRYSLQTLPRLSKIRLPGGKLELLTRASVFHGADCKVPELLSFPSMPST